LKNQSRALRFAHNQQTTARFLRYQSRASRAIETALRYQSKPRLARNQKRASRNQSRAARVIRGALRAAVSYTSKYFFPRFVRNQYFLRKVVKVSCHWRVTFVGISAPMYVAEQLL
jgi:hypothetical protein